MAEKNEEVQVEQIEHISVAENMYLKSPWPDVTYEENHEVHDIKRFSEQAVLPSSPRTNRVLWWICLLIVSAVILAAVAVLILYLIFHPKHPKVELRDAILRGIDIDRSSYHFKTEMIAVLEFSNSNDRVYLRYEDINFKLYFRNEIIAAQVLDSFGQRRGNTTDRFAISLVSPNDTELTPLSALIMEHQIQKKSRILYKLSGTIKTIARLGGIKYFTYRLNLDCHLLFSAPPHAVLRHKDCTTSR